MFFKSEAGVFGIDGDGPLSTNLCNGTDDEENIVEVPHVDVPLTDEQFSQLQTQISPHESGANYGIDIYIYIYESIAIFVTNIINLQNECYTITILCYLLDNINKI